MLHDKNLKFQFEPNKKLSKITNKTDQGLTELEKRLTGFETRII